MLTFGENILTLKSLEKFYKKKKDIEDRGRGEGVQSSLRVVLWLLSLGNSTQGHGLTSLCCILFHVHQPVGDAHIVILAGLLDDGYKDQLGIHCRYDQVGGWL